jgi:hypothetical protein
MGNSDLLGTIIGVGIGMAGAAAERERKASPQGQYELGKNDAKIGKNRQIHQLDRDDDSKEWLTKKSCIDAYNSGYDDGMTERLAENK